MGNLLYSIERWKREIFKKNFDAYKIEEFFADEVIIHIIFEVWINEYF